MHHTHFHRPASVADAVKLAAQHGDDKFLAGGQSMLPSVKLGLLAPTGYIDLAGIKELRGICPDAGGIVIGAATTHAEVAASAEVRAAIPALAQLAGQIGDRAVRNRGTLGGSLAHNDPAACYPAAVLALGATIRTDRREIAADDYFRGLYETALEPGEMIVAVRFPVPQKAAWLKFRQAASRFSIVGVFVARTTAGVRVAVTGASMTGVFRPKTLEVALNAEFSAAAAARAEVGPGMLSTDVHASAEYRAHLIPLLTGRAVAAMS
jgi:carbon-monoxide dehydrogenase medium subunit